MSSSPNSARVSDASSSFRRGRLPALVGIVLLYFLLFLLLGIVAFVVALPDRPGGITGVGYDFRAYYNAASSLLRGGSAYFPSGEWATVWYPPPTLFLYIPFALLPFKAAYGLWLAANVLMYAVALCMLLRLLDLVRLDHRDVLARRSVIICLWLAYYPWIGNMLWGQSNLIILFLSVVTLHFLVRRSPSRAGTAAAAMALIKLTPSWVFLYFLVSRQWRALATGMLSVGVAGIVAWCLLGSGVYVEFLASIGPMLASNNGTGNISFNRLLGTPLFIGFALVLFVLSLPITAENQNARRILGAYSLYILFMVMLSPAVGTNHLVLLLIPVSVFLTIGRARVLKFALLLGLMLTQVNFALDPHMRYIEIIVLLGCLLVSVSSFAIQYLDRQYSPQSLTPAP